MIVFEQQALGVGSNRSANCAKNMDAIKSGLAMILNRFKTLESMSFTNFRVT